MSDEGRRVFSLVGICKVVGEHLCSERCVAVGLDEYAGTIVESDGGVVVVYDRGLYTVDRGLHFVEALLAPVEAGKAGPLESGMRAGSDGLLEFALGGGEIFLAVGDGCAQVMGAGWVDFVELGGDGLRLVDAATDDTGSLAIKLAKVGEGVGVARVELDGLFELRTRLAGEAEGV